jgi:hypothetical protein
VLVLAFKFAAKMVDVELQQPSKAAMGLGGILMAATTLGVVTLDPMVMVAGLAAQKIVDEPATASEGEGLLQLPRMSEA